MTHRVEVVGQVMSRFPELRRIENALANEDDRELRWALAYCESRLSISPTRQQEKHWQALITRVQAALDVLSREE
jgi:hypothetical protein